MRKLLFMVIIFMASLFIIQNAAAAFEKKVEIVTTTSDIKSIAEMIGGNKVEVLSLTVGTQNPHFIDPKPSYMLKARKADLFISNGLELEVSWESSIIEGSRNSKIKVGAPGYLDASRGIQPLEIPQMVDRSSGDIHVFGNPHYILDPINAKIVARNIAEALSALLPQQYEYFQQNLFEFNKKVDQKMSVWRGKLMPYDGERIITYHKTWSYFAARFGLKIVSQLETKPGIPPSANHLREIIELIKNNKIKVILQENLYSDDAAKFVAKRADVHIVKAPTSVGAIREAGDYFTLIDIIVDRVVGGFSHD
ncbi:MAG: metal ABC transporter substrate-binding protein [Candidatus Omnitrophica bacterium]|nr:metal ABC transporter substrate-binding protein [Candidatus Omnitrophota bacterium]